MRHQAEMSSPNGAGMAIGLTALQESDCQLDDKGACRSAHPPVVFRAGSQPSAAGPRQRADRKKEEAMPRVPVHTIGDAPEPSREALRRLERRMGRLLNIHAEMAHAPAVLAAYQGIQHAIAGHGSFDARIREAIALAVAAVDKCAYCQSAHTAGGRAAGWSLEETVGIRDGTAELDQKLASLLAVAREIAANIGYVADPT
jgi:AhpD family alkylhydroperoxidase